MDCAIQQLLTESYFVAGSIRNELDDPFRKKLIPKPKGGTGIFHTLFRDEKQIWCRQNHLLRQFRKDQLQAGVV